MVENELVIALIEKIESVVENEILPVQNGDPRPPKIINGFLPPKRTGVDDDYPFVIVRPETGTSERESTTVKVAIIIGCYSLDYDGYAYCLNVMTRIRNALAALDDGILNGRYVLQYPLTWKSPAEPAYPFWEIYLETNWYFNTPQIPFREDL